MGEKPKQVRKRKTNPAVKKVVPQEPVTVENGHSSQILPISSQTLPPATAAVGHYTWNTNAEDSNSQPTFQVHPFTASQYTNLVNTGCPSAMDPDELRRRLLNSFK